MGIPLKGHMLRAAAGLAALLAGGAVYLTDRNPESVHFVSELLNGFSFYGLNRRFFGTAGYWLPDFIHPFAFILLTGAFSGATGRKAAAISLFWFLINIIFELGQKFTETAVLFIPGIFSEISWLGSLDTYFKNGTFDISDITAITAGSFAGWIVLCLTSQKEQ